MKVTSLGLFWDFYLTFISLVIASFIMSIRVGHLLERERFIKKHENCLQLVLRNFLETCLVSVSLSLSLVGMILHKQCLFTQGNVFRERSIFKPSRYNNAADRVGTHFEFTVSLSKWAASSLGVLGHRVGASLKCSSHAAEDLLLSYLIIQEFCKNLLKAGCQKLHSQHFNTSLPGEMLFYTALGCFDMSLISRTDLMVKKHVR